MNDFRQFVPNVHFEQIPIRNLVSNQDYQRGLHEGNIIQAAENFDLCQINPVKVSQRDGINFVFDGQHTIEIVRLVSGSDDTPVWCMIYDDLSYCREADIFANQMKYKKPLLPFEVFNANVEAGNQAQLIIRDLVESYGMKVGGKRAPGVICAVSTLESIYNKHGYHALNRVLRLSISTWEGEPSSFSANMLNALAKIVTTYQDQLNDQVFKEKLGAVSVKSIIRTAKERRPGSMGFAEAMVLEYNGKKKFSAFKLPINKLYEKNTLPYSESEATGPLEDSTPEVVQTEIVPIESPMPFIQRQAL